MVLLLEPLEAEPGWRKYVIMIQLWVFIDLPLFLLADPRACWLTRFPSRLALWMSYLHFLSAGITGRPPRLPNPCARAGDLSAAPYACTARVVSTKASPDSCLKKLMFFKGLEAKNCFHVFKLLYYLFYSCFNKISPVCLFKVTKRCFLTVL